MHTIQRMSSNPALCRLQSNTHFPCLPISASCEPVEHTKESANSPVHFNVIIACPPLTEITEEPTSNQRADLRQTMSNWNPRNTQCPNLGPDSANIIMCMCRAVSSNQRNQRLSFLHVFKHTNFCVSWDTIATFLANGVDEVVQALAIQIVIKITHLICSNRVAWVEVHVVLDLSAALWLFDFVNRLTVVEIALLVVTAETAFSAHIRWKDDFLT